MPLNDEQLKEAFNLFDTDNSGTIDPSELIYALEGLGGQKIPEEEVAEMRRQLDTDGDGSVDYKEFCALVNRQQSEAEGPREIYKAFQAFDVSKTGEITIEDLCEVARSLGYLNPQGAQAGVSLSVTNEDIKEIHGYCAANGAGGRFTFEAWKTVMQEMASGRGDLKTYQKVAEADQSIWTQLEQEESAAREERQEEKRQKVVDAAAKKERAAKAREAYAEYRKDQRPGSPRWNEERQREQQEQKARTAEQEYQRQRLEQKRRMIADQKEQDARDRQRAEQDHQAIADRVAARRQTPGPGSL